MEVVIDIIFWSLVVVVMIGVEILRRYLKKNNKI